MRAFSFSVAIFLAILVGYVCAYFAIVEIRVYGPEEFVFNAAKSRNHVVQVDYRVGGKIAATLFAPIHACDRHLRFRDGGHDAEGFTLFCSESEIELKD
jgi:hypothetical protein